MSFWKNRPLIITIILLIVLAVLLFSTSGNTEGQSIIGSALAPVQEGLYNATASIGGFFGRLFATTDLDKENAQLKNEVAELQNQLRDYESTVQENQRLKELLNVKDTVGDYDIVTAQVIGKNPGEWFQEFTINVGKNDGVSADMIVLTGDGLLGRVVSVSDTYAKVMSFLDTDSGVAAILERTRDYGIVKAATGSEQGTDTLELFYLPQEADVLPGDKVVTSGVGGVFPKGLLIGQVTEVGTDTGAERQVLVKSAVDFRHVEEVVVVKHIFSEVEE